MIMGMPKQGPVIAIDGPAGTGKSSATKRLAEALKFIHVDTGALYRSIAHQLISKGFHSDSADLENQASEMARSIHIEFKRDSKLTPSNRVFANGQDVTTFIRTPEVSMLASQVSAFPPVRAALLALQRRMGCAGRTILEGRDIGTVIFPDADIKFFLTASVDERAKRRLAELEATGADAPSFEDVRRQIAVRDEGDSTRKVAPLKKAEDAIEIDTSSMTLDQVVAKMESIVRQKLSSLPGVKK